MKGTSFAILRFIFLTASITSLIYSLHQTALFLQSDKFVYLSTAAKGTLIFIASVCVTLILKSNKPSRTSGLTACHISEVLFWVATAFLVSVVFADSVTFPPALVLAILVYGLFFALYFKFVFLPESEQNKAGKHIVTSPSARN